jgi:hypothetical protein
MVNWGSFIVDIDELVGSEKTTQMDYSAEPILFQKYGKMKFKG